MRKNRYPATRKLPLEPRLAAYSAAAGAALLAASSVDAQPLYTDVIPDEFLSEFAFPINFDGQPSEIDGLLFGPGTFSRANGKAGSSFPLHLGLPSYPGALVVSRFMGNYPNCSLGYAVTQAACAAGSLNCQYGSPGKGGGAAVSGIPFSVPYGSLPFYLKVGGSLGLDVSLAKGQVVEWEGWIRVQRIAAARADGGGDAGPVSGIVIKDYAFFPAPPAICDVTALPVELVSFDARLVDGSVRLAWETASETNNAGFEIQYRPADQDMFSPLAFVEGAGTNTEPSQYSHTIDDLVPGTYQFRLKQIDLDGGFEYSSVVEVAVEVPGTHFLGDAYPNPFNPQARFTLVVSQEQSVRVELFDATGQMVSVIHDGVVSADTPTRFVIEADNLPSGAYLYRVIGETFSESRKVTLVK